MRSYFQKASSYDLAEQLPVTRIRRLWVACSAWLHRDRAPNNDTTTPTQPPCESLKYGPAEAAPSTSHHPIKPRRGPLDAAQKAPRGSRVTVGVQARRANATPPRSKETPRPARKARPAGPPSPATPGYTTTDRERRRKSQP